VVIMNLDHTLAFTALLELLPGFAKLTAQEAKPLTDGLAAAMTEANPKNRWDFAQAWIDALVEYGIATGGE
jgi:hypothetical protein